MNALENKKLMQEIFAGVAEGDGSKFSAHLAEDVTLTITGRCSWSQTFHGKERVLRDLYGYVRSLLAEPGNRTRAFRFLADEDWVVVEACGEMTTKAGARYDNHYCLFYRLRNGLINEIKEYQDTALTERVLGPYPGAGQ